MAAMPDELAPPSPAATVVLLRPGRAAPEILLTQRPSSMTLAVDLFVFPGGRVDAADGDDRLVQRLTTTDARDAGEGEPAFAIAAIRELFEEAGVLLAERRDGRAPDAASVAGERRALLAGETTLAAVAEALDPVLGRPARADLALDDAADHARRFDTRFYAAELPPAPSRRSSRRGRRPSLAHRARRARGDGRGQLAMWVPTCATLQQLEFAPARRDRRPDRAGPAPRRASSGSGRG